MLLIQVIAKAYTVPTTTLPAKAYDTILRGGVHVEPDWLPLDLTHRMRADAETLQRDGLFVADGLTNTAKAKAEQGFSAVADRQTFRGGEGWSSSRGDARARAEFAARMDSLRIELSRALDRPPPSRR